MKLIIADNRMPVQAKTTLSEFGDVLWFATEGITYPAISGHPDIFMTQINEHFVVAPNIPVEVTDSLSLNGIVWQFGNSPVGKKYPDTSHYNALVDRHIRLHHLNDTDRIIIEKTSALQNLNVKQGYCRCNCLSLNGNSYFCSDKSIEKALRLAGKEVLFVHPDEIELPGFSHGFIGGTAGIYNNIIFFCGSLSSIEDGETLKAFLIQFGYTIIELYDGPLIDVGGIFFV